MRGLWPPASLSYIQQAEIAVITFSKPPVNALSIGEGLGVCYHIKLFNSPELSHHPFQ
jgi:hypothetical protein